jgi:hypothetical protein
MSASVAHVGKINDVAVQQAVNDVADRGRWQVFSVETDLNFQYEKFRSS